MKLIALILAFIMIWLGTSIDIPALTMIGGAVIAVVVYSLVSKSK